MFSLQVAIKVIPKEKVFGWAKVCSVCVSCPYVALDTIQISLFKNSLISTNIGYMLVNVTLVLTKNFLIELNFINLYSLWPQMTSYHL